jgi:hypothetical protein
MARPDLKRVPEWYHGYINQVAEDDLGVAFQNQTQTFIDFLQELPVEMRDYRYAEGKWTIREVLQHILDGERVFSYRALCLARRDQTPLPSFDENSYASNSKASDRDWNDLVEEFGALRRSNEIMFRAFDNEQLESGGIVSGNSVYVLALGFIIVGHVQHHVKVIKERYLTLA